MNRIIEPSGVSQPIVHVVDDDEDLRHAVAQRLEIEGLTVRVHDSAEAALSRIGHEAYAAIVTDIRMPKMDGLELLKAALAIDPTFPVILMTGHGDVKMAVNAMHAGAYDFIEKPFEISRMCTVIERALEKRRLVLENRSLRCELDGRDDLALRLVGRTPAITKLREQIVMLAGTDVDVLVKGETGAGKEVVARALHDFGSRSKGNFVAINCAAMPAEIIEAELFGHEPGAFTGAQKLRIGKLEHAQEGTLFLDEIESMPVDLQAKLLRAIETRTIERLGSNKSIPLNIRIVAATKSDLSDAAAAGKFRSDLYYRLNVVALEIPPLKARKEDIPLLFFHLAREARGRFRREIPHVPHRLEMQLMAHDWPGNVRELRNYADRFVLGMWTGFSQENTMDFLAAGDSAGSLAERLQHYERSIIAAELKRHDGALKPTYEALNISRKGLYDKMKRLGMDSPQEFEPDIDV